MGKAEWHVTADMKKDAYAEYATLPGKGVCVFKTHTSIQATPVKKGCEVDHPITRELGVPT